MADDAELLRIHGEMSGVINEKLSYRWTANLYDYTLSENDFAWNKPAWDGQIGVKYNLRDKIIAGAELTGTGKRKLHFTNIDIFKPQLLIISMNHSISI